jgi:signal transduction histidine kinase
MRGDILVVDDEAGPRESLRMILKQDHVIRTAASGPEALAAIENRKPDLVFLDLRMPGMDGTEVLRRVKETWPDVAVAIITAHAGVESARLAVRFGAVDYLTKPYSVADVTRIVDKALDTRREQHDAQVLAAQLAKMTETLGGWARSLDAERRAGVTDAVNSLVSVQTSLPHDLESVRKLSELGEVTAEVTHDINNLLTVILTNSQYLLFQLEGQPQAQSAAAGDPAAVTGRVSRIVRAAEDCSMIIRRVKDFVRLNVSHRPTRINVSELLSSAVDMKRDAVPSQGGTVEYVMRLRPVPEVYGDEVALRTVIVNLIDNSLDAITGEGTIELSTAREGDFVHVTVKDNGCGMPPEVLANATQAFFSANKNHGTGLGLSTADRVAKRHKGTLRVESEPGAGTTVTIELPVFKAGVSDSEQARAPKSTTTTPYDEGERGTVILVDDEDGIRELMAAVLETDGFHVVRAVDGLQGWELFQRERAEANGGRLMVVTDHEMPGLEGRELARRIKAADERVPVLIVSGYISERTGPEDELMPKPFDVGEFLASVNRLCLGIGREDGGSDQ